MKDLHQTQRHILKQLVFMESARHSGLKGNLDIENNTLQHHIDTLVGKELIEKIGLDYKLTKQGRVVVNRLDTDTKKFSKSKKVSARLFATREADDELEIVFYTRKKHPFFNKQGAPSGKIKYGEKFEDAAVRELKEETGLVGKPTLFNVVHYLVVDESSNEVLDDKIFFNYFFTDVEGELNSNEEGKYFWVKASEIREKVINPFDSVEDYIEATELIKNFNGELSFEERVHVTGEF